MCSLPVSPPSSSELGLRRREPVADVSPGRGFARNQNSPTRIPAPRATVAFDQEARWREPLLRLHRFRDWSNDLSKSQSPFVGCTRLVSLTCLPLTARSANCADIPIVDADGRGEGFEPTRTRRSRFRSLVRTPFPTRYECHTSRG